MKSTSREYILGLRTAQLSVFSDPTRFRVLVAGRRFGKTELALTSMLTTCVQKPNARAWYVAPSFYLAKSIAWDRLKSISKPFWSRRPLETELTIFLISNSTMTLRGADNPDSLRGNGLDYVVLDEFASMRPEAWDEAIRPALSDRNGRALFIGTPKGHNHFYELFRDAKTQNDPEWSAFQYTTAEGGLIPEKEITSAFTHLDTNTFNQEYNAEFTGSGNAHVYYPFDPSVHVTPLQFEPLHPLIWAIDFNVNPMSMLLMQCVNGGSTVHVLDEISLKHSNTQEACNAFLERLAPNHKLIPAYQRPLTVKVYGDASGNQHRTSGATTDWTIVKNFFSNWVGSLEHTVHVNKTNPAIRDRVNCVNSRLKSADGEVHMLIDPRCKELIRDLDRVVWEMEPNGQTGSKINKSDPDRTHMSDALGYYIAQAFPLRPPAGHNASGPLFHLS
jgi:hypothetical protein